ncbi:Zinc finger protein C25B8.19c [Fusarium oxysporum f. sp. albedinis]|nr:Zinc finger protein C25B8.19c [Fusarium oxysporum f. sp. albedinis]
MGLDAGVSLKRELPRLCTRTTESARVAQWRTMRREKGNGKQGTGDKSGAQLTASHLASDGADCTEDMLRRFQVSSA